MTGYRNLLFAGASALIAATAPLAAEAAPYGFASNQITNLTVGFASGNPFGPNVTTANTNIAASAFFTGSPSAALTNSGTVGSPLTLPAPGQAFSGPGAAPADNTFGPAGPPGTFLGTRADALIAGTNPDAVRNVAEGYGGANAGVVGSSNSTNSATITFGVSLGTSEQLQVSFSDLIQLIASTAANPGESATASISNSFVVSDLAGTVVFSAAPTDINRTVGSAAGVPSSLSIGPTSFDITLTTGMLGPGFYNVSLTSTATQNIAVGTTAIPEPASLALLGCALVGLAVVLSGRRRAL